MPVNRLSNIKSIQRGTGNVDPDSGSLDITVNAVNTSKSVLIINGPESTNGLSKITVSWGGLIASSTLITLFVAVTGGAAQPVIPVGWQLIEYY